ncbi:hypothetical protein HUU53_02660 [Candidatus Micrarchaeota archaeon]|nr:hypothetical protein [Candidatus Micrarchaeota archaeon]
MFKKSNLTFYLIALEPIVFLAIAFFIEQSIPLSLKELYTSDLKSFAFFGASVIDALFVLVLSRVFYQKNIVSADQYKQIPNKVFLLVALNTLVVSLGMVAFLLSFNWIFLIASIALFYVVFYYLFKKLREFEENYSESFITQPERKEEEQKITLNI